MTQIIPRKFVSHDVPSMDNIMKSMTGTIAAKINAGKKLTAAERNYIMSTACCSTACSGVIRHMGWEFDFRPVMKRFVCYNGFGWYSSYAFNKTQLCKHGNKEVYEIPNNFNKEGKTV